MFVLLQLQMFLSALEKVLLFPYSLVKCSGSSLLFHWGLLFIDWSQGFVVNARLILCFQ